MLPILNLAVRQTGVNKHYAKRLWNEIVETIREQNHGRFDSRTFIIAAISLQEQLGLDYSVDAYRKARSYAQNSAPATGIGRL